MTEIAVYSWSPRFLHKSKNLCVASVASLGDMVSPQSQNKDQVVTNSEASIEPEQCQLSVGKVTDEKQWDIWWPWEKGISQNIATGKCGRPVSKQPQKVKDPAAANMQVFRRIAKLQTCLETNKCKLSSKTTFSRRTCWL